MTIFSKTRVMALVSAAVLTLSGCSLTGGMSEESKLSLSIAAELHDKPMLGFAYSDIAEPDSMLAQAFNGGTTADSSFFATPTATMTKAASCDAAIAWAKSNLTDVTTFAQYNASVAGLAYATASCRLLLTNWVPGFSIAGMYKDVLIQVVPQGSAYLINIDGSGATLAYVAAEADPAAAATSALLDAINAARGGEARNLTEAEMQQVWDNFSIPVDKMTADWSAADDGTVPRIHLAFEKQGLMPFCLDIGPWNAELAGADPGAGYPLLLIESFADGRNFGTAVSGACA